MAPPTLIISHYGVGGSLLYVQEFARALEKKNYPAVFYLPKNTELGVKNNSQYKFILKEPSTAPAFLRPKFLKYLFHVSKYLYNAFAINPDKNIKIAHLLFSFYLTDLITIFRLKRKQIKIILTVHEIFPHKPFLGGGIDKILIRKMYELSDVLLVHTDSLKKEIVEIFSLLPDKIRVIPHGYFESPKSQSNQKHQRKIYGIPEDKRVLLFFGSIRENKGLDIMLKALEGLEQDYFLLIAGERAGASERSSVYYEKLIEDLDIKDRLFWIKKYIPVEEIPEVFEVSDAMVLPYKKTFHAQSGVLNLAIGYEKPCVVSDVGGIGETVREYNLGIVVRSEDVQDLRRGIKSLFEGKGDFGFKRYKEEKSWDKVCDKLIRVYEELIVT